MPRSSPLLLALSLALPFALGQQPEPPKLRLGDAVAPVRYIVDLTVVPTEETAAGVIDIELDVRRASPVIWVNATELNVKDATLRSSGRTVNARVVAGGADFAGFAFDTPVEPGRAVLHIAYEAKINSKSSGGIFRNKDGGEWYAYTQFESIDARRAFPCFDEPSFKAPWRLTLHVRANDSAFANTPQASETAEANGMKAVRFAETKPLSSYLVAFAAGPFEIVDAGKTGMKGTPLRIIATKGRAAEAKYAAEVTPQILTAIENYFGIPYPFEKLDSIAVPLFFGAMENPGLITYSLTSILSKAQDDSVSRQRGYANTAAHEMAHLWFGDLVTTAWWDDIWLNEAFATWMSSKTIQSWKPDWHADISAAGGVQGAMGSDSLVSARKIRQPVQSKNDIANAFDGITYGKGAAVIRMFEHWVGPETFRKGVQIYMRKHSYGNATAADFLAAISEAAGRDIAPAFSTFLDQPGVPVVTAELRCAKSGKPTLAVSQKRYLPLGSKVQADQTWQTPLCFWYMDGGTVRRQCSLMAQASAELPLNEASSCPATLMLNDGETGYYRVHYRGDLLQKLLGDGGKRLTAGERMGTMGDVQALVRSGDLPAGDALRLAPLFADDPVRQVVSSTVGITAGISRRLVPDELRPNYARFVQKMYGDRARKLGWLPRKGEDEDTGLLRPLLVGFTANEGNDAVLIAQAQELAKKWLDDHNAVPSEVLGDVLVTAARHGGRALYDRCLAELKKEKDEKLRNHLLTAIASFRDPEIVRANFELVISKQIDARESMGLLFMPLGDPATRGVPYEFVTQNYDRIAAALPAAVGMDMTSVLPMTATVFCDAQHRAEAEAFFKDRAAKAMGGPRMLAQALEQIDQCIAMRSAQQAAVAEFLNHY